MSQKDSTPQLVSPCDLDWDSLTGNNRVRFCQHCQRSVHNFESLNEKQIHRLIVQSGRRLCVRFVNLSPAAQATRGLYKIGRRASVIAASAFSASLSLSGAVAGNVDLSKRGACSSSTNLAQTFGMTAVPVSVGGTIRGFVFDPQGAVIVGASVTLTDTASGEVTTRYSDGNGEFRFDGLQAGTYHLKIAAQGFSNIDVPNIVLRDSDETRIDQTLSIAAIEEKVEIVTEGRERFVTMGVMAAPSPTEPVVKAANEDDLNAVQEALRDKPDANIRDVPSNLTALECAIRNANREILQLLLSAKADVNARGTRGQTVLMMLGEEITDDIVWDLINAGAKVNYRDEDGDTSLISVASVNNVSVLKVLLDAGANVNAKNNEGSTALMMAAASGLVNNLKVLLSAGAQVDIRDKQGKTALMYAKENTHSAAVRLLKTFGAADFEEPQERH